MMKTLSLIKEMELRSLLANIAIENLKSAEHIIDIIHLRINVIKNERDSLEVGDYYD